MTEQERELFERRSLELAQARRVIDDLRERYTDVSKALSHVLHDNASLEAERDAALNAQEAAEKEVFALRAKVSELEYTASFESDLMCIRRTLDMVGAPNTGSLDPKRVILLAEQRDDARARHDLIAASLSWVGSAVLDPSMPELRGGDSRQTPIYDAAIAMRKDRDALRARVSELEAKLRYAVTHAAERRKQATDMLGKLPTERSARARELYMTADEYDGSMNERYVLAEEFERLLGGVNDEQAASNPPATPAIDESGEPAEYDVADTRPPGERVKVGDRVRCVPNGRYSQHYMASGIVVELDGRATVRDDGACNGGVDRGFEWRVNLSDILEILPESP